jgi:hypothetical protein
MKAAQLSGKTFEIRAQILEIFATHGETDQPRRDTGGALLALSRAVVRHRRGMRGAGRGQRGLRRVFIAC